MTIVFYSKYLLVWLAGTAAAINKDHKIELITANQKVILIIKHLYEKLSESSEVALGSQSEPKTPQNELPDVIPDSESESE